MPVNCINDGRASISRFLWCALWYIYLRIHRVQLECVMVVRTRRRARSHVAIEAKTYLAGSVTHFTLRNALRKPCGCSGDVPGEPVRNVHFRHLVKYRFG